MATEKTNFKNVVIDEKTSSNNNNSNKNPIEYGMDFNGSEVLKWQSEPFEAFGKTTRANSAELSSKIYRHFKETFHELAGCNITLLPNAQIGVELYFERNSETLPEGKIMNLDSLVDASGSKSNLYERMQVTQNRRIGKMFTLNNETKLLLANFMFGGKNANMPNNNKVWNNEAVQKEVHISAMNDPFRRAYNTDRVLVRVTGLDIRRILQEMYGKLMVTKTVVNKEADTNYRSDARYEVRFIKAMVDGTFIMNIEQFDAAEVEKLFMKENPVPQHYFGVQMYN